MITFEKDDDDTNVIIIDDTYKLVFITSSTGISAIMYNKNIKTNEYSITIRKGV